MTPTVPTRVDMALEDGTVTFRYRDRRRGNASRLMRLAGPDFVRRFLLHVLPRGFVRVRHYGLQAHPRRRQLITRARQLLGAPAPPAAQPDRESWQDLFRRLTGRDPCVVHSARRASSASSRPPCLRSCA